MHAYASRCFSRCRNRHHRVVGDQQQRFTVCTVWTRHTSLYRLSLRPRSWRRSQRHPSEFDCMKKRHPVLLTKLLLCKTDVIIRQTRTLYWPKTRQQISLKNLHWSSFVLTRTLYWPKTRTQTSLTNLPWSSFVLTTMARPRLFLLLQAQMASLLQS